MKLCFIASKSGEFGGSEILWYMTAMEALENGADVLVSVHVSYLEHEQIKALQKAGAKIQVRPENRFDTLSGKIRFKLQAYLLFINPYASIYNYKPNLIIVSQGGTYDAVGQTLLYNFLMRSSAPFVLISQFHLEKKVLPDNMARRARILFAKAHTVFFVSRNNQLASEETIGMKITNGKVINNPVKLKTDLLDWPDDETLQIACVARINFAIKRQDVLLRVLAQEKWQNRSFMLNLFGDGPDAAGLKEMIQKLRLQHKVKVHGHVSDVRQIWNDNHLFILPSIAEGLPLSLIEANLLARPAITTKVGDNEKLVVPGKTGFLVKDFSDEALDEALERAWQQKQELMQMGINARQHAMNEIDVIVHKTLFKMFAEYVNR